MIASHEPKILIVPAVTPFFLEKEEDWFSENILRIIHARASSSRWERDIILIKEGAISSPERLIDALADLGYERVGEVRFPGEISRRGGFITVFPIGSRDVYRVEFLGNRIEAVRVISRPVALGKRRTLLPRSEFGELSRLVPGDYVVHLEHGIGIFRGLVSEKIQSTKLKIQNRFESDEWGLELDKKSSKFFVIEYAPPRQGGAPDRLFVPVEQAKKLSVYYGFETPQIHRLGSDAWVHTKRRVKEEIVKMARELLSLYAARYVSRRPPYARDPELERVLEADFPHVETECQLRALRDIDFDLSRPQPMDRLLIGDVGFGKTEIALRVAFRVVLNGKQVAVLAPTTILADQHFHTFRDRLGTLGVNVEELSRIVSGKTERRVLKGLSSGEVDIVVGTHRLLSDDIRFKDLGLLIIDEEQRFGVRQKEKLKMLRMSLDVLSLSATPIPRTMYMALTKLRPVSVLATPPAGRLAIKTFVLPYSKRIIREAIAKELGREGQVYFLHNRVETISKQTDELRNMLPGAKIAFVHGRMDERELMRTMEKFRSGDISVLVATTIIENGIDLSNVNTLIVADAVRLGLGQAHQIRGRVGRGHIQAYAYFLYSRRNLSVEALERLTALQESEALGSGYELAQRDLEIRGAGNILGKAQSGTVNAVGLNLYMQMLSEAVEQLHAQKNGSPPTDS